MRSASYCMTPDKCPCGHVWASHWYTLGCGGVDCPCTADPPRPGSTSYQLDQGELEQLRVMALLGHRAAAAADALVSTVPSELLPDRRISAEVRAGYLALSDLLAWLTALSERGALPQPARRWTLGLPTFALEELGARHRGNGTGHAA